MLKQVKINATEGSQSSNITVSEDYFYLPSLIEMGGSSASPYNSEGSIISWFTGDIYRAKFRGMMIPDTAHYFTNAADPTQQSTNTDYKTGQTVTEIVSGDIWKQNGNGRVYIYATAADIRYYGLSLTDSVSANAGGKWISAYHYWERSPYVGNSTGFYIVNYSGYTGGSGNAANANGVCPCFSI